MAVREHDRSFKLPELVVPHDGDKRVLDGITAYVPHVSAEGFYKVRPNNVAGHFPEIGLYRGVEVAESLAVLACYVMMEPNPDLLPLLKGLNIPDIAVPAFEGDYVDLSVNINPREDSQPEDIFTGSGRASVLGDVIMDISLSGALKPKDKMVSIFQRMQARRAAAWAALEASAEE